MTTDNANAGADEKAEVFSVEIDTSGIPFTDEGGPTEVAAMLREVATRVWNGDNNGAVRDAHGHPVCNFRWTGRA